MARTTAAANDKVEVIQPRVTERPVRPALTSHPVQISGTLVYYIVIVNHVHHFRN